MMALNSIAQPFEGELRPLRVVVVEYAYHSFHAQLEQDVWHESGWAGRGWYTRKVWTCRHCHMTMDDAFACEKLGEHLG